MSGDGKHLHTFAIIFRAGLIRDWSLAIDGGAHFGSWTGRLAWSFDKVLAYEPTPESFAYLVERMAHLDNVECRNQAIMNETCRVNICAERQVLTSRFVQPDKRGRIHAIAIDDLELERCGFIKLDLEGAEGLALDGAKETLARCRPVLCVEIGGLSARYDTGPEAVHEQVIAAGYREVFRTGVDRVYAPLQTEEL